MSHEQFQSFPSLDTEGATPSRLCIIASWEFVSFSCFAPYDMEEQRRKEWYQREYRSFFLLINEFIEQKTAYELKILPKSRLFTSSS